ncbi:hypothetical protein FA15DRAFT_668870 [Coprinopsis marcescibilis]|uniref:Uncharacterized protein n=1 Tax=Coprinopsis marcescibilis TaxID=230819 RepID=A0A5C3KYB5_COPMA|nr:hypothetical protein FA15DRAFT_668870 [Coprinopsis marcescibilis]
MKKYYRLVLSLLVIFSLGCASLFFFPPVQFPNESGRGWDHHRNRLFGDLFGHYDSDVGGAEPADPAAPTLQGTTRLYRADVGSNLTVEVDLTQPPLYEDYLEYEANLPQNLPTETRSSYIHFANHVHLLGFNNHMQELLLNAHLAYLSNRSFVVYEYVWNPSWEEGELFSVWPENTGSWKNGKVVVYGENEAEMGGERTKVKAKLIPSRIPSSALVGGWVGGHVRVNSTTDGLTPISRARFNEICPPEKRFYIRVDEVNEAKLIDVVSLDNQVEFKAQLEREGKLHTIKVHEAPAEQIMHAWISRLKRDDVKNEKCVEIVKGSGQVFDIWVFGTPSVHTAWPSLQISPALQHWSWSPLIYGSFLRNAQGLKVPEAEDFRARPLFGDAVRDLVQQEHKAITQVDREAVLASFGYPPYPRGYAYPPLTLDERGLRLSPQTPSELKVLPYPRTPSGGSTDSGVPGHRVEDVSTLPILALHLRRGDFKGHCKHLEKWNAPFMGFCSFGAAKVGDDFGFEGQANEEDDNAGIVRVESKADGAGLERRMANVSIVVTNYAGTDLNVRAESKVHSFLPHQAKQNAKREPKEVVYPRRCFPEKEDIGKRVQEVVEDWVLGKFVGFVEGYEKSWWTRKEREGSVEQPDDDDDESYRSALSQFRAMLERSLSSVYMMTNGDEAWALEAGREIGRVLKDVKVSVGVEVELEFRGGEREESKRRIKRSRGFDWVNPNWNTTIVMGSDEDEKTDLDHNQEISQSSPHAMDSSLPLNIASSRNLRLTQEEKWVGQAVDMYVAQRAELFIGNGFSSMTANVVILRVKDKVEDYRTRFW